MYYTLQYCHFKKEINCEVTSSPIIVQIILSKLVYFNSLNVNI